MRGFGSPQAEFASEVLIDVLAEKVGMDPLEFRYKNVYREGDTTPAGSSPDVIVLPGLLDMLRPLYKAALKKAGIESAAGKKRGVGISIGIYKSGLEFPDSSEAWAELTANGVTIYNTLGGPRSGRGHRQPRMRPRVAAPPCDPARKDKARDERYESRA